MGSCCSCTSLTEEQKEERARARNIDRDMKKTNDAEQQIKKLLLLGAGESGKSTLFKQMITLYGRGYPVEERKGFTGIVYNNTIHGMKVLLKFSAELPAGPKPTAVSPQNEFSANFIHTLKTDAPIDEEVAQHIKNLWADEGIMAAFDRRAEYQLPDSAAYFFDRIDDIAQADYIPTEQDVLRSRVRTTGIVETEFEIGDNIFRMFDVGGQRNERKKWIHCFENVTCVIFVAAISEYDQVLYEDETTNRMHEAINLFDEICNSRWFKETSIILFLNKKDLFESKIQTKSIQEAFPEYNGEPNDLEASQEFLQNQFESKNRSQEKEVYTHVTCATDTSNIAHVFNAVKDIIIKKSLREGGLM